MVIGVCTLELNIPMAFSLKDKRRVVKSVIARLREAGEQGDRELLPVESRQSRGGQSTVFEAQATGWLGGLYEQLQAVDREQPEALRVLGRTRQRQPQPVGVACAAMRHSASAVFHSS